MEKDVLLLDGPWKFKEFPETARRMRDLDEGGWMDARVPSSIYTCLAKAGTIDPADLDANPENFKWVSGKSWIFRKEFQVPSSLPDKEQINLVLEGMDTVSQIWLNDKLIGKTENMFIPHQIDITEYLKPSKNVLHIKFLPAIIHAERLMQRYGRLSEHHFGDIRRSYLRKAQYQFGSVMGPSLPGCGIFRSVRIEGLRAAKIDHLHIRTVDCNQHYADVRVAVKLDRVKNTKTPLKCKLHLSGGGLDMTQELAISAQENQHATLLHIDRPILWWPRGYGVQHQYHLKAELYQDGHLLDIAETDFGIRTIRVNRNADKAGTKFQFEVNEQPIYIKGANWMPLSPFPGSQTAADYEFMLTGAANAHFNMLRVWAGGFYENPEFYKLCDKLGILVWQDFMFASAYYPDRQWFSNMVEKEARTIIERLRNHPCLALWCGNSRIDSLHEAGRLGAGRKFYGKAIYHTLLPGLLSELDPDREYIPTTPFSDLKSTDHSDPTSGTTHSWDVWNNYAGQDKYEMPTKDIPRFVAEFGLQSIPDAETLEVLGVKNNVSVGAFSLEKHNYQPGGQQRIARYVADDFTPSINLKESVWQSQVVQARAVKRYVEHLRSHNSINSGCLFWTFNDSAPSVSFSSIDALQNPKALYFYAKRFFAPVLITLTQTENVMSGKVTVINDSLDRITATLDCRLLDLAGKVLDQKHIPVALSPLSRSTLYPLPKSFFLPHLKKTSLLHMRLLTDDSIIAENIYFFCPNKYLEWPTGDIELEVLPKDGNLWQITLKSQTVIRDLQIIPPCTGLLSDNFITLLPGQPGKIDIQFEKAPAACTPVHILCANQV